METTKSRRKSISILEKLRKTDKTGHEYLSAKDLAKLLGYSKYSSFIEVLYKAKASFINTDQETPLHFKDFSAISSVGNDLKGMEVM